MGSSASVRSILSNEKYAGEACCCRKTFSEDYPHQEEVRKNNGEVRVCRVRKLLTKPIIDRQRFLTGCRRY